MKILKQQLSFPLEEIKYRKVLVKISYVRLLLGKAEIPNNNMFPRI